jgi:hypothetical protein
VVGRCGLDKRINIMLNSTNQRLAAAVTVHVTAAILLSGRKLKNLGQALHPGRGFFVSTLHKNGPARTEILPALVPISRAGNR